MIPGFEQLYKIGMNKPITFGDRVIQLPIDVVRPSPENDVIYGAVSPDDSSIKHLAEDICGLNGIIGQPLIVSLDNYILSGHRRHMAARIAGLTHVPCIYASVRRETDLQRWDWLLALFNRSQRVRTLGQVLREEGIHYDPEWDFRRRHARRLGDVEPPCLPPGRIELGEVKHRREIGVEKIALYEGAKKVIESLRDFWPLSVRQIHYALLNDPPLRNTVRKITRYLYRNDRKCYKDLCDLLLRGRVLGDIPWEVIEDETRVSSSWPTSQCIDHFIKDELRGFLRYYERDLQQSQPHYFVIQAEKLTLRSIVDPIARRYGINYTIGRGYSSGISLRKVAQAFKDSGKEKLVAFLLTDFDPDGEQIAQTYARLMRDDHAIDESRIHVSKVAITHELVQKYNLKEAHDRTASTKKPESQEQRAKDGSANRKKFVDKFGERVYELEALSPPEIQKILEEEIRNSLDRTAFNYELDEQRKDREKLQRVREQIQATLENIDTP